MNFEYVILLHGMGRTKFSMLKLEKYLLQKNYKVINIAYPSTRLRVQEIANKYVLPAVSKCQNNSASKIHFITHSLGGIIVRQYLQTHVLPIGSRVVMLAPPNKGSEVVDYLKSIFLYRWLTGKAGQQLTTDENSLPNQLKAIEVDVGIIAGTKSIEPWFSRLIPDDNDGKVSVQSTHLNEMKDLADSTVKCITSRPLL